MPLGVSMFVWVTCDNCGCCMDSDFMESASKREAVLFARMNGWMVRKNGQVICDICRSKNSKPKETEV